MYCQNILKTLVLLAITSIATADLHSNAVCVDTSSGYNVYDSAATSAACAAYHNRHTGSEWWDTCPDCTMITTGIPHCKSSGGHIGGDEITYYCKQHGAGNALTS
ncbi:hypothetical protein ACMFMG_007223 [Clarireedia jacksonii]